MCLERSLCERLYLDSLQIDVRVDFLFKTMNGHEIGTRHFIWLYLYIVTLDAPKFEKGLILALYKMIFVFSSRWGILFLPPG